MAQPRLGVQVNLYLLSEMLEGMVQPFWGEATWAVSCGTSPALILGPVAMLLDMYPEELKTYVHTETCTWAFTAALFMTVKIWKQLRCPSVGEWINKQCSIQIMKYYSALKGYELLSHEKT